MMEDHLDQGRRLPDRKRQRRHANKSDLAYPPGDRGHQLGEVEAQCRGSIHVEIDMMRLVAAPKERNFMQKDVPKIKSVVEQGDGERHFEPARQRGKL